MWRVPRQTSRGPCCETQSPHEIVQDKEARQQGLWWLHVRQVCPGQVSEAAEALCASRDGSPLAPSKGVTPVVSVWGILKIALFIESGWEGNAGLCDGAAGKA